MTTSSTPGLSPENRYAIDWAVSRWKAEVQNRPLQNVHRRALDTTWRQVIRHFGGDDEALCDLLDDARSQPQGDGEGGWRLVPVEPTEAMIEAGVAAGIASAPEPWCPKTYAAMLAAAPTPPPAGEGLDLEALERVDAFVQHAERVFRDRGALVFCSGKTLRPADLRALIALAWRAQHGA